jgi:hypothetical protein
MAIDTVSMTNSQFASLLDRGEGHFLDFKAKAVSPAKLTKALSAFANAMAESCSLVSWTAVRIQENAGLAS